jgi:hypothetical protein
MDHSRSDADPSTLVIQRVLVEKRRRLGTALRELATELARERRRCAELEREVARLRRALGIERPS